MRRLSAVLSWLIVAWTCYVFLGSLPYKFTAHPDTQHIFGTIGEWLGGVFGTGVGEAFRDYGAYAVGAGEALASLLLLLPIPLWLIARLRGRPFGDTRRRLHLVGGLLAAALMSGAVFFHLFTPLGIEVLHEGESDGGSLFLAAVSILVLGTLLAALNLGRGRTRRGA